MKIISLEQNESKNKINENILLNEHKQKITNLEKETENKDKE